MTIDKWLRTTNYLKVKHRLTISSMSNPNQRHPIGTLFKTAKIDHKFMVNAIQTSKKMIVIDISNIEIQVH